MLECVLGQTMEESCSMASWSLSSVYCNIVHSHPFQLTLHRSARFLCTTRIGSSLSKLVAAMSPRFLDVEVSIFHLIF